MDTQASNRILLVQYADIGDLILTLPAVSALRESLPDTHLTLLTSAHAAPLVPLHLIDQIIALEKREQNATRSFFQRSNWPLLWRLSRSAPYDAILYFHHFSLRAGTLKFALLARLAGARRRYGLQNGNAHFLTDSLPDEGFGARHQAQYWLDLVGMLGAPSQPRPAQVCIGPSPLPESDRARIVIHPGSGSDSLARRWSLQRFLTVARQLREDYNAEIVFVGTAADLPQPSAGPANDGDSSISTVKKDAPKTQLTVQGTIDHDLTGRTDLPQLAAVLREASLVIGADSGVMHLAAAVQTPQIALFGPSNHEAWAPWAPEADFEPVILRSGVACSPCSYVGQRIGQREGCSARTCMHLISTDAVIQAARSLLKGEHAVTQTARATISTAQRDEQRLYILGLPLDGITYEEWLTHIESWVNDRSGLHHVCTLNPEFAVIAQHDINFRHILQRAALCVPDGVGMLWAARRKGRELPARVTGSDGLPIIAKRAAETGWRIFFLGAAPGVAAKAAHALLTRFPGLQIVGSLSGSPTPEAEDELVQQINASDADLLFVAFGAPIQDQWIARNSSRLKVSMAMGVGGAFDFLAGEVPRAPYGMRQLGLEWLFRLLRQPWRWRRMLRLPRFVLAVLRESD